ncbi:MAG: hypothetical protein HY755_07135 [Nitrospirae bacterium]|nr:hypothetical protein [Nitrospirota bacterium]
MRKSIPILILSISILFGNNFYGEGKDASKEADVLTMNIRIEIKKWIDELYFFDIESAEHTTWFDRVKIRIPDDPKPFAAGRFKVSFKRRDEQKAIICQTEEIVGHYAIVVPGQTKVDGYIQLLDNPMADFGSGPKLNPDELDYFIQTLYRKFSQPLGNEEADLLNKTKDWSLSIMFSGKQGINEYHENQIKKLKAND